MSESIDTGPLMVLLHSEGYIETDGEYSADELNDLV